MDHRAYTSSATGQLVHIELPRPDYAFVPSPLPQSWQMPADLWQHLMDAREAIARLDGTGRHMPNHALLLRPLQQREALRSSSMEGTYATPEELLLYQAEPREPKSGNDPVNAWREVYNYGLALRAGQQLLDDGYPSSLQLIRTLHSELLRDVRGDDKSPGEFRKGQVIVGASGRYIPPPPHQLQGCLDDFERSLREPPADIDPLLWAFMVHYQFETIHPFNDGNGRVGRLLLSLQIYKGLDLACPWLYLSAFFERHKDEYIDYMFRVSTHGDWGRWLSFCLLGAQEQANDAMERLDQLVALKERYHQEIGQSGANARIYPLLDELFETPIITIPSVVELLQVTYPTAKADIERLVTAGILRQGREDVRPMYFYSPEIMDIAYREPK